ncbi:hypothetical protein SEVIR_2G094400v4 [Setaria viridis]|uniref:Uncharacterized protein n=2 Tax=Setaria TaxID=4554 RepID=K3ZYQ8_SETIT|nr:hypothetical protein SETIT_2G091600v2 [Setaria italica]TKW31267.1 hypothetical protein SEVIR_2G094400v2 [Setaria viridis]
MASAKKLDATAVLGLSLVALLLLSAAAAEADISYHAMGADGVPGKNHALFRPGAIANTYSRGCEAETECRGA